MSFGKKFGELIKRRRAIEGLTQEKLASRAFGNQAKKTRISGLEKGKVDNPQPKTVDALCAALGITGEEIDNFVKTNERPPHHENITDFFHLDGHRSMDFEVAVDETGDAAFFHDRSFRVELKRAEYFCDDQLLVFLDVDGRRRTHTILLPERVSFWFKKCKTIEVVHVKSVTTLLLTELRSR